MTWPTFTFPEDSQSETPFRLKIKTPRVAKRQFGARWVDGLRRQAPVHPDGALDGALVAIAVSAILKKGAPDW